MTTANAATAEADLPARFQGLSDEKRFRILEFLRAGEQCVCDPTGAPEGLRDALEGLVSAASSAPRAAQPCR